MEQEVRAKVKGAVKGEKSGKGALNNFLAERNVID